jgi:hypothetical protein
MGFQIGGFPSLRFYPPAVGGYDTDAQNWISRVETADGQALEDATKDAMNQLVLDMKTPYTWRGVSINDWSRTGYALCSMAARTITGAMEPVNDAGQATPVNFTGSEYNRKTGIKGVPGNFTHINTPYNGNSNGQDNAAYAQYHTEPDTGSNGTFSLSSGGNTAGRNISKGTSNQERHWCRGIVATTGGSAHNYIGLRGATRYSSTAGETYVNGSLVARTSTSTGGGTDPLIILASDNAGVKGSTARVLWTWLGEDLDLIRMEAYIDDFLTAINAAF